MSTFAGLDGAWYLSKQGTVGLSLPATGLAPGMADPAGNLVGAATPLEAHEPEPVGV
jgi:hypothetical protein